MSFSTIRYHLIAAVCIFSPLLCASQEPTEHRVTYISFQVQKNIPTYPMSVNDRMTVTGFYIAAQAAHGFTRTADGTFTSFDVPGSQATQPASINKRGEITGSYVNVNKTDGFVRSCDGTITSFSVQGSDDTLPYAINEKGAIVGFYNTPANHGTDYGFVRSPEGIITTFNLPGGADTVPYSINTAGEITGEFFPQAGGNYGFVRFPDGAFKTFDYDYQPIQSFSINRGGDTAGVYTGVQGFVRSRAGVITLFDAPGLIFPVPEYFGINTTRTIFGDWYIPVTPDQSSWIYHGFVRSSEGTVTSFDPPDSKTTMATGINDFDVITGFYVKGANTLGFLRVPKTDHGHGH